MARLKTRDFTSTTDEDPLIAAELMVPRAKQRGVVLPRSSFTPVPLVAELADPISRQRRIAEGWALSKGIDPERAPMFPAFVKAGNDLPPRIPEMVGHMEARDVGRRFTRLVQRLNAVPDLIAGARVTPVRLRRTRESTLADEGYSVADIAAALDQSGKGAVLSYGQQTAALAERIDRALGESYAKLALGFRNPPRVCGKSGRRQELVPSS